MPIKKESEEPTQGCPEGAGTLGVGATARDLAAIGFGALIMGAMADLTYATLGLSAQAVTGAGAGVFPPLVGAASALLLVVLAAWPHLPPSKRGLQECYGAT